MRALTLKPHWAHSVAWLGKRIENRAKPIPQALLGQRIAIHAGAALPNGWADELRAACPTGPNRLPLIVGQVSQTAQFESELFRRRIRMRSIVATAVLARCVDAQSIGTFQESTFAEGVRTSTRTVPLARRGPWADPSAAFWWHLEDVRVLERPIHVERGQLGLWRLSDHVSAMLDALEAP